MAIGSVPFGTTVQVPTAASPMRLMSRFTRYNLEQGARVWCTLRTRFGKSFTWSGLASTAVPTFKWERQEQQPVPVANESAPF
jgi:hypothetical protein